MAVLRKNKVNNYTVIDNNIFKNKGLSLKAKGLLCEMLSLPDEWEYSLEGLVTLSADGVTVIRSALKELENLKYFKRQRLHKDGKLAGVEYIISETPMLENLISENLKQENLILENQPQLNTNTNKRKKEYNTNICSDIIADYNMICSRLAKVERLTESRKKHIRARLGEHSREDLTIAFHKLNESDFACGNNDRGWEADFDWLMKNEENITKVLEGKYDNRMNPIEKSFARALDNIRSGVNDNGSYFD